ncbi:MAG TPA: UxaA family hydrolase, partial [Candidatus Didemnitutus sp.]|nr:UxaA family hydrolase [Candidatus Didemnitutus sp.]
ESNPSAGNKLRGLYNITLKSLGAVHKKDPRTRIDAAIDYAEPLGEPGFYFMNGPGNDLEGIAGQVGAGCNLFLFITGNGSITNFPFVPTLKITTTTRRHQLLIHEMDINAGRYLDGESMEALTAEAFDLVRATAAGRRSQGERAGHSQVSLWRNWQQTDTSHLAEIRARQKPDGFPITIKLSPADSRPDLTVNLRRPIGCFSTERVGLVLPTSMCAAQIARLAAERMNAKGIAEAHGLSRFVALTHSEGCGFGGENMYHLLYRTYRGYATHPNVAAALLLEHGCEKVPNDAMRRQFETANVPLDRFGWASVQLDGGIEKSLAKVEAWFTERLTASPASTSSATGLGALTLGLMSAAPSSDNTASTFVSVTRAILAAGGSVLLPESDPLLANAALRRALLGSVTPHATLAYGEPFTQPGLHLVATESDHWVENLTGLGGCGAHLFLTLVSQHARQGHPLLPVLQVAEAADRGRLPADDIDTFLSGNASTDITQLLRLVTSTAQRELTPASTAIGATDFQLSRGLLGVTT